MYKLRTPDSRPAMPKFAVPAMIALLLGIIIIVILVALKQSYVNAWASSIAQAQATQEITFDQDIVIGTDNAILYLPKNTIHIAGTISILPLAPDLVPVSDEGLWTRPQAVNVEYRDQQGTLIPHITFSNLAQICFKLTQEQWQDFEANPDDYQVQYYDEEQDSPQWVALSTLTHSDQSQLCGQTNHLSIFALAVRVETPTFTPTAGATSTLAKFLLTAPGTSTASYMSDTPRPKKNNEPTDVPPSTPKPTQTKAPPTATPVPPTAKPPTPTLKPPPVYP